MINVNAELLNTILTNQSRILKLLGDENCQPLQDQHPEEYKEVESIISVMVHIKTTAKFWGVSNPLISFFGFPKETIHLDIYRDMKMTIVEQSEMPWRYRDKDENGLERLRAIVDYYTTNKLKGDGGNEPFGMTELEKLLKM